MYMSFTNALEAFGATQSSAQSYVATQRENFFKDYKDRLSATASAQAEKLGLDQEQQEKLGNAIDEVTIAAPIIGYGAKKAYGKFKSRATKKASKDSNETSNVDEDDDNEDDANQDEATDSTTQPLDEEAEDETKEDTEPTQEGGEVELTEQPAFQETGESSETATTVGGGEETADAEFTGAKAMSPEDLQNQGNITSRGAEGAQSKLAETQESAEDATADTEEASKVGEDAAENTTSKLSTLAGDEETVGEVAEEAEEATGGIFSDVIAPAAAIAGAGYALYDLFHHSHSKEDTAAPSTFLTGHATGISDAITRGGFAAGGFDSVTTAPSQNSAF